MTAKSGFARAVRRLLPGLVGLLAALAGPGHGQVEQRLPPLAASALLAIDQHRTTVVNRILFDWSEALAQSGAGLDPAQLRSLLSGLRADHLLAASLAGSLEGLRNVIAAALMQAEAQPVAAALTHTKALGDANDDLVYTPVAPCRLGDTRVVGGHILANTTRDFKVWVSAGGFTAQGGSAGNCNVPANPPAVVLNLTAVNPVGGGWLVAYAAGGAYPSSSVLNYQSGIAALANGAILPACVPNCTNQLSLNANQSAVDVVIDIVGYFKAPGAPIGTVSNIATGTGLTGGPITTAGTISVAAGGITATQLASNAVTQAKLSPVSGAAAGKVLGTDGANLQWQTAGGGSGTVTSVGTGSGLTGGPITSSGTISVAAGGVGAAELASNAVTTVKITDANVTKPKLSAAGGTNGQVLGTDGTNLLWQSAGGGSGTVTSVGTGSGLTGGPITGSGTISVAAGGITATQLASNAVTTVKITDANVTKPKLSAAGGTNGQVLGTDGTNLLWQTATGGVGGAGTPPRIPMWSAGTTLADSVITQLNGNIGIGIASPMSRLEIAAQDGLAITGFQPFLTLRDTNAGNTRSIIAGGNGDFGFYPNSFIGGNPAMIIKNLTGNVGIGALADGNTRLYLDNGANAVGVYSNATTGYGVLGAATSGSGLYGYSSSNGIGVRGFSATGSGVYGESNAASLTAGGVYGNALVNGGIGVIGQGDVGTATGVFGVSASNTGFGVFARNLAGGRALYVEGNAAQDRASYGMPKAMVYINANATVARCYNGLTNSYSGNCGFSVSHSFIVGNHTVYRVDFGFQINDRFLALSQHTAPDLIQVASTFNYVGTNAVDVDVFTTNVTHEFSSAQVDFILIVF